MGQIPAGYKVCCCKQSQITVHLESWKASPEQECRHTYQGYACDYRSEVCPCVYRSMFCTRFKYALLTLRGATGASREAGGGQAAAPEGLRAVPQQRGHLAGVSPPAVSREWARHPCAWRGRNPHQRQALAAGDLPELKRT